MKRSFEVKTITGFTVEIPDELITPEALQEFSSSMFKIDDPEDLFQYATEQISKYGEHFIEGLGKALPTSYPDNLVDAMASGMPVIRFREVFREVSMEPTLGEDED